MLDMGAYADLGAFAPALRLGIGLPFGFLRWIRPTLPRRARNRSFSARRQVPSAQTSGVVVFRSISPSRNRTPSCAGGIRHRLTADDAVAVVDRGVTLAAEDRDGNIGLRRAFDGRFGLRTPDLPARLDRPFAVPWQARRAR